MSAIATMRLLAPRDQATVTAMPFDMVNRRGGSIFIVDFQQHGNSAAYRTHGWSGQEDSHVWSVGASCGLSLPAMTEQTPVMLDVDFANAVVEPLITTAVVRVFANGHAIGSAKIRGRSRLRCAIPATLLPPGEPIELRFDHANYFRMDMTDLGREDRVLAMCFYSVCAYPPWLAASADFFAPHPADCPVIETTLPPARSGENDARSGEPALSREPSLSREPALSRENNARLAYRFGADTADRMFLGQGWRFDETGHAWTAARQCDLEIPGPERPGSYLARFDIVPIFIRSVLVSQRITILLNQAVIGQFQTGTDTTLSVALPPELIEFGAMLRFSFLLPDGEPMHEFAPGQERHFLSFILDAIAIERMPPSNAALVRARDDDVLPPSPIAVSDRFLDESIDQLPAAVKDALGLELSEIMALFESMGDNCAFGLAQRKAGCEVLGLLRFANAPLKNLMTALDDEFRDAADKTKIEMRWVPSDPGEFILASHRYGIRWHTSVFDPTADQSTLFGQQAMRLSYLRRKFYEGLRAGRKIFTISRAEPRKHPIPMPDADEPPYWEEQPEALRLAELLPLFIKLNEYGTNTVLYLTRCAHGRRSGTVELIAPGVMRGYVDDFVISQDPALSDHAAWLRVAINAWLLDRGPNASFRRRPTK
jgi:hypothetical protein